MSRLRQCVVAGVTALVLTVGFSAPAHAFDSLDDLPEPTSKQLKAAVTQFEVGQAVQFSVDGKVQSFAEESDDSWTLATDVLFRPDEYELPSGAGEKIVDLLTDVPEGEDLRVDGHTDSRKGEIPNQELSEKRAEAVADAILEERDDLNIATKGHGSDDPATTERDGDESTFADNRRVEITRN